MGGLHAGDARHLGIQRGDARRAQDVLGGGWGEGTRGLPIIAPCPARSAPRIAGPGNPCFVVEQWCARTFLHCTRAADSDGGSIRPRGGQGEERCCFDLTKEKRNNKTTLSRVKSALVGCIRAPAFLWSTTFNDAARSLARGFFVDRFVFLKLINITVCSFDVAFLDKPFSSAI